MNKAINVWYPYEEDNKSVFYFADGWIRISEIGGADCCGAIAHKAYDTILKNKINGFEDRSQFIKQFKLNTNLA